MAALLAHGLALRNGFTNWDDPGYLLTNPLVRAPLGHGLHDLLLTPAIGYPIPVTILGYAGQHALFGLAAVGYHAVSLALHVGVVLLAFLVARRLGPSARAAAVAATLFAVHPLTVEPVAWVVGQKDLWAALLVMAALAVRAGPRGDRPGATLAAGVLALAALAAKPGAVAVPLLLAGMDWTRRRSLRAPGALALYAVTGAAAVAATFLALREHAALGVAAAERVSGHSLGVAAWSFGLHVRHLVWPAGLLARYFPPDGAAFAAGAALGVAAAAGLVAGTVAAIRTEHRFVAFGIAGAFVAYLPASGILPLPRGAADSYVYLPLAIAVLAPACGLSGLLRKRAAIAHGLEAALLGAAVLLAAQSARQTTVWHDAPALWEPVEAAYPDDPRAAVRAADAALFVSRVGEAIVRYQTVASEHPDFLGGIIGLGDALERANDLVNAELVLADGARRGGAAYRDRYGFFLIQHAEVEPSDAAAAAASLREIAPVLVARGKRPAGLRRAADLLDRSGDREAAAALRARAAAVEARDGAGYR